MWVYVNIYGAWLNKSEVLLRFSKILDLGRKICQNIIYIFIYIYICVCVCVCVCVCGNISMLVFV